MKKILRLVATSVLTLSLVACGGSSEKPSTTSSQKPTTPSTQQPTTPASQYAKVTSVTIAAGDHLEQVSTSLQKVTVSATLNSGVDPNTAIEWYVDGTKASVVGKSFEYTPTELGEHKIQAKAGGVSSNEVVVKVSAPGLGIETVKVIDSDTIEIKGPEGAVVVIEGKTLKDGSYYDLTKNLYHIELKEKIAQGDTLKITLSKAGASATKEYLYDTRAVKATVGGKDVTENEDGSYTVVKPYGPASEADKTYTITAKVENIAGTNLNFLTHTDVPEGAEEVKDSKKLVTLKDGGEEKLPSYSVSKDTIAGDYVHTITIGAKHVAVTIHVVEPETEVGLVKSAYTDDNPTTVGPETYDMVYGTYDTTSTPAPTVGIITKAGKPAWNADTNKQLKLGVKANEDGSYTITKPYENDSANKAFLFKFHGERLAAPEYMENSYTITLRGPSRYSGEDALLSVGIETDANGGSHALNKDALKMMQSIDKANAKGTKFDQEVYQVVTRDTPVGAYTFTLAVKEEETGAVHEENVVVNIVDPKPTFGGEMTKVALLKHADISKMYKYLSSTVVPGDVNDKVTQVADGNWSSMKVGDYLYLDDATHPHGWYQATKNPGDATWTPWDAYWKLVDSEEIKDDKVFIEDRFHEIEYQEDEETNTYTIYKPKKEKVKIKVKIVYKSKNLQSALADYTDENDDAMANYEYPAFQGKVFIMDDNGDGTSAKDLHNIEKGLVAYEGEHDAKKAYTAGDWVSHEGKYYKAKATIGAKAWDDNDWTVADANDEKKVKETIAYRAENIYLVDNASVSATGSSKRLFTNYTYTVTTESDGVDTKKGKAVVQLASSADAKSDVTLMNDELVIDSSTVAGNYSYALTCEVGGKTYSSTVNIVVADPEPKLFVLADGVQSTGVKHQELTLDNKPLEPKDDGEYYVDVSDAGKLEADFGLTDIATGKNYPYTITKTYPDAKKNMSISGSIKVTGTNDIGYVTNEDDGTDGNPHTPDGEKPTWYTEETPGTVPFHQEWNIDDTLSNEEPGDYTYTFTIGGTTKEIVVHVGDYKPKLVAKGVKIEGKELGTFGDKYIYDPEKADAKTTVAGSILLSSVNFAEGKTLYVAGKDDLANANIEGTTAQKVAFNEDGIFEFKVPSIAIDTAFAEHANEVLTVTYRVYEVNSKDATKLEEVKDAGATVIINAVNLDEAGKAA